MSVGLLLLFFLSATSGQARGNAPETIDIAPISDRFPSSWYPPDSDVESTPAPQRGAPYTAILVSTWVSGKTQVTQSTLQARDAAGRRRDETLLTRPAGHGGETTVHIVSVGDPIAHCAFRWTEPIVLPDTARAAVVSCESRRLHYTQQGTYAALVSEPKEEQSFPGVVDRSQPLGKRVIEGFDALGVRHSRIRTDSERHTVTTLTTDMWYSPVLQELLELHITQDGEESKDVFPAYRLTEIKAGEPPESLFYPPPGYIIEPGH